MQMQRFYQGTQCILDGAVFLADSQAIETVAVWNMMKVH